MRGVRVTTYLIFFLYFEVDILRTYDKERGTKKMVCKRAHNITNTIKYAFSRAISCVLLRRATVCIALFPYAYFNNVGEIIMKKLYFTCGKNT